MNNNKDIIEITGRLEITSRDKHLGWVTDKDAIKSRLIESISKTMHDEIDNLPIEISERKSDFNIINEPNDIHEAKVILISRDRLNELLNKEQMYDQIGFISR